jgi:beta-N-acetylhexosaminidase
VSPSPLPLNTTDSILARLSVDEKIGQLLMLGFDGSAATGATGAIRELKAGGLALLANAQTASEARELLQSSGQHARDSGVLLPLISIDHEGGLVQRIRSGVTNFGSNWQLGQTRPIERGVLTACTRGAIHGRELSDMGIQMNLSPVLDVWDNPQNTVIGERSFSSDPKIVEQLGVTYIQGLQAQGVLAVAKHFPGHGSSTEDSHLTLPVVRHDRAWLDNHELVPFRAAFRAGVAAVMTAHVSYPLVDPQPMLPASLSPAIVGGILRRDLGYSGLVLTDDMGAMQAITDRYSPGEAAVRAILAGADMLISVGPLERQRSMAQALRGAVGNTISTERLDESVRRILKAKLDAGLLGARQRQAAASCSG